MSSVILVDGRDIRRDRALLKETKRKVKEALAKRTADLVDKYRAKAINTVRALGATFSLRRPHICEGRYRTTHGD